MINNISISDCNDSNYIKLKRMSYVENGIQKQWDIVETKDSVSVLIYNKTSHTLVVVEQFRPAVFLRNDNGYIYELCAGLVDKENKTLKQIAIEEVYEECGYKVDNLYKIAEFYSSVGTAGAKQTLFFTQVNDADRISMGGGVNGEQIKVIHIPINEISNFLKKTDITPSLGYAFMWFMSNKENLCAIKD